MKTYDKQVRILTAIGLTLIAVVFLFAAFSPLGEQTVLRQGAVRNSATVQEMQSEPVQSLVNINTASAEELEALPGIGAAKAQSIINERRVHGRFASKEDIMRVEGIGESVYTQIKDLICVQ